MIPLAVLALGTGVALVLSGIRGQSVGALLSDALSGAGGSTGAPTGTGTKPAATGTTGTAGQPRFLQSSTDGEGTDNGDDGTSRNVADLDPRLGQPLARMMRDAAAAGYSITLLSGRRTRAKQERLWRDALAKYGSPAAARHWVAPPGSSRHELGLAADLTYGAGAQTWAHANASRYGLGFRMVHEPWHIEPRTIT